MFFVVTPLLLNTVADVCALMIEAIGHLLHPLVVAQQDKGSDKGLGQHKDKDKMDDDNDDSSAQGPGLAPGPGLSPDDPAVYRLGVCVVVEQLLRSALVLVVEGMAGVAQVGVAYPPAHPLIRSPAYPLLPAQPHLIY